MVSLSVSFLAIWGGLGQGLFRGPATCVRLILTVKIEDFGLSPPGLRTPFWGPKCSPAKVVVPPPKTKDICCPRPKKGVQDEADAVSKATK